MNTISQTDILQLVHETGPRCVSIYMPVYPVGQDTPQNLIRFRELLHAAETALAEKGANQEDACRLLAPATDLLERPLFWKALSHGLAVLVSDRGMKVWHLPLECEELCVVGTWFHVTPLVMWLVEDSSYYVLAASQNDVRLLQGTRYRLHEVQFPGLPPSLKDALRYDRREGMFQAHSGQRQFRGKEGMVFHGQGGEADVAKDEIASFFQIVDTAVCDYLRSHAEPLVFAGVDYLFPIYRQHNHYPHLLPAHISGNPTLLRHAELQRRAWEVVEPLAQQSREAEIQKYWNLVDHGRTSNRVEDIMLAACAGAVETLFIDPTGHRFGVFDPKRQIVRLDETPQHDSDDLVNLAAIEVLTHRGKVEPAYANIPGGGAMAAVFRYAVSPPPTSCEIAVSTK